MRCPSSIQYLCQLNAYSSEIFVFCTFIKLRFVRAERLNISRNLCIDT